MTKIVIFCTIMAILIPFLAELKTLLRFTSRNLLKVDHISLALIFLDEKTKSEMWLLKFAIDILISYNDAFATGCYEISFFK